MNNSKNFLLCKLNEKQTLLIVGSSREKITVSSQLLTESFGYFKKTSHLQNFVHDGIKSVYFPTISKPTLMKILDFLLTGIFYNLIM